MHRPGGVRGLLHALGDGGALELALRNAAEDAVGVAGRAEVDRRDVAHHHQVSQRLVAVTVNQHRAARRRRIHADDLVGGGGAVGDHVAAFGVEHAGNVLLRLFVRAGVIQQRPQFGHRNRNIRLHGVRAEEIVEQAAHRALLERGAAHVARRTESVFAFAHVFKQRLGQRRQDGVDIFVGILFDLGGDVGCRAKRILEEAHLHAQIVQADVQRGIGVGERVQRHVFVQLTDLFAQLQVVFVPVEDHPAQAGVVLDQFQQVFAIVRVNDAEIQTFQRLMQFTDRLFFEVDTHVIHDGDNVHMHFSWQSKPLPVAADRSERKGLGKFSRSADANQCALAVVFSSTAAALAAWRVFIFRA